MASTFLAAPAIAPRASPFCRSPLVAVALSPSCEVAGDGRARLRRGFALVPDDRQGLERGLGSPPGIGDHGDAGILHLHDLAKSRHGGDLRLVVACELAAEYRARLDGCAQHAGQLDIDGIDLAAVELVGGIEPLDAFARDLPVLRVLELDGLGVRRGELGGRSGNLAVAGGTVRSCVRDDTVGHRELRDRHLPIIRRRLQQHHARERAATAHIVLRAADAAAAAGRHVAPDAFTRKVGAGSDLLGGHLLPVAFELLGDQLRKPGESALAHLRARDPDHAGVVGLDHDPDIDLGAGIGGLAPGPPRIRMAS